jgi:hypothetical protein
VRGGGGLLAGSCCERGFKGRLTSGVGRAGGSVSVGVGGGCWARVCRWSGAWVRRRRRGKTRRGCVGARRSGVAMRFRLPICVCVCVRAFVSECEWIFQNPELSAWGISISFYLHMYAHPDTHTDTHTHIHLLPPYAHTCTHIHTHTHTYTCYLPMHAHTHTQTHTHTYTCLHTRTRARAHTNFWRRGGD